METRAGSEHRGKLQVRSDWSVLAWGRGRPPNQKLGILCDWFGEHIWLSLIGPELEARAKIREAGSPRRTPAHCRPITAGAVVWLLQRLTAEAVAGQGSVVINDRAVVLSSQSLRWVEAQVSLFPDLLSSFPFLLSLEQHNFPIFVEGYTETIRL